MPLALVGISTALPKVALTQRRAAELALELVGHSGKHRHLLPSLYHKSRVRQRFSVLLNQGNGEGPKQYFFNPSDSDGALGPTTGQRMARYSTEAPRLALDACSGALCQAGLKAGQITHLVTVSCTGFESPGVDLTLVRELGLPSGVMRTHVGFMGCHGAMNGLRVAAAFVDQDPKARVLLCAVELCSLHFSYINEPEKIVANALFADGAAALVGASAKSDLLDRPYPWRLVDSNSHVVPNTEDAMRWRIGDHGFEMTLAKQIPELIEQNLKAWLSEWLGGLQLQIPDINAWAIHPGGPRILAAVKGALRLTERDIHTSTQVLEECGNMSSATILFILERLSVENAKPPCVMLAFGPGLTIEVALLR